MGDIGSKDEPVEEEYGDVETGLTNTSGRRSLVGSELIALELAELSAELAKLAASGALAETQLASSPSSSRSWQDVEAMSNGRRRMPRHAPHRRRTHSARASLARHVQGTHATLSVSRIRPRARPRSAALPHNATHRLVLRHTVPNCSVSPHAASLHVTSSEEEYGRGMGADDSSGSEWSMSSTKESDINLQVEAAAFTACGDVKQTIMSGSEPEIPPMGQFLLPLITGDSSDTSTPHIDNTSLRIQLVQHKRILEALVSDGEETRNNFIQEWKQEVARKIQTERLEAEKKTAEDRHESISGSENPGQHGNSEAQDNLVEINSLIEREDSLDCDDTTHFRNLDNCQSFVQPQNFDQQQNPGIESIEKLADEFSSLDMEMKEIDESIVPGTSKEYSESSARTMNSKIIQKTAENLGSVGTSSLSSISHSKFRALRFFIKSENSRRRGLRKKSDYKSDTTNSSDSMKNSISKTDSDTQNYSDSNQSQFFKISGPNESLSLKNPRMNCVPTKSCDALEYSDTENNPVCNKSDSAENLLWSDSECANNSASSNKTDKSDSKNNQSLKNLHVLTNDVNKTQNSNSNNPGSSKNSSVSDNADDEHKTSSFTKTESSKNVNILNNIDDKTEHSNSNKSCCLNNVDGSKNVDIKTEDYVSEHSKSSNYAGLIKTEKTNSKKLFEDSALSDTEISNIYNSDSNNPESSENSIFFRHVDTSKNNNKPEDSEVKKLESSKNSRGSQNVDIKTTDSNSNKPEIAKNFNALNEVNIIIKTEDFNSNNRESSRNFSALNHNCDFNTKDSESNKSDSFNLNESVSSNSKKSESSNLNKPSNNSINAKKVTIKTEDYDSSNLDPSNSNKPESLNNSSSSNKVDINKENSNSRNLESSNLNKPLNNLSYANKVTKTEDSNSSDLESANSNLPESSNNSTSSNRINTQTEDSNSSNFECPNSEKPESLNNVSFSNKGNIETKDSNSNKPESLNNSSSSNKVNIKTENSNSRNPESSNSNKLESSNSNKPESLNNSSSSNKVNIKTENSNSSNPESSNSNKPESLNNSSSSNKVNIKTENSNSRNPESSNSNKLESSNSNKPESLNNSSSSNKVNIKTENSNSSNPESSNSNKPESLNNSSSSNKVNIETKDSNSNKSECSRNCGLRQDLPSLVEAFSSIASDNLDNVTEEISSDYEHLPETKLGRAKGRQCKARARGAGPLRSAAPNSGIRAVSLGDVAAVLCYLFNASHCPPLNEMKLIPTEGFPHRWRQYYETCSILTCTNTCRKAGLTDSEWRLRLQYGRCYCCVCMFRIHNRCAILDYADFIVTQLVMAGRQTTVDAVILLRLLELNKPYEILLMTDYGRKCEYVMTHGIRLVGDSSRGKHSTESTQLDLQTYRHRQPPVRKNIRQRNISETAEHISELGLRIMASRLVEFMNVDHRVRHLLERGCCCRPLIKADLPPDNSVLGKDGTCKWALEALVNLYDGFSYHDTRALFKMDLINTGGDSAKVQAVNDSLNAGHKEWDRRYYAKLYSQFSHRSVHGTGPILTCATCKCLCRTKAVFDADYRAGVTNSRLMQSMKNSLSCERTPEKYGTDSVFDIAMSNNKYELIHSESEINSFVDNKICDLIRGYFLCVDHSQHDPIYNIERNTKKHMAEKMFRRNNTYLANKRRPVNDLCEAALEHVFTKLASLVKTVEVARGDEIEKNKDDSITSSKGGKSKGVDKKTKCAIGKSKSKRTRKVTPSTQENVNILQVKENIEGEKTEVIDGLKTFEEKLKTAQRFMEAEIRDMLAARNIPVDRKSDAVVLDYTIEDLHEDMEISAQVAQNETTKSISVDQLRNDVFFSVPISDVLSNSSAIGYGLGLVSTNSTLDMSYLTANTTFSTPNTTFTTPNMTFTTPDRAISPPNSRPSVFISPLSHNSTSMTLVPTPTSCEIENESLDNCTIEEIVNDDRKVEQMIKEATADRENIENVVNALLSTVQGVNDSIHNEISKDMSNLALDDEEIEILQDLCQNCHIEIQPNEHNVKKCKDCMETDDILFKYLSLSDNLPDTDAMHGGNLDTYAIENIPEFQNQPHSYNPEVGTESDSKVTATANCPSKTDSEVSDNDFVDVDDGDFDDDSDGEDLNDMIRDLLRSVNSIEVVMDTVMAKCRGHNGKLDMSKLLSRAMDNELLAVLDEKLIALYRHMPGIHKRQMAVWRRQEKWTQCVWQGEWPPSPSPPHTPPPPPPARHNPAHAGQSLFAVCPGYHVARFREVRRKLVHMIEQQKYFDHIRSSLERKLTPLRKKSPDKTDVDQSNVEEASEHCDLPNKNTNFEYVEKNAVNIITCERIKAEESSNTIGRSNEIDEHQIYTVERSVNVEDVTAIDMNKHGDVECVHKNNTQPEVERESFAIIRNSDVKLVVNTAICDDNVGGIKDFTVNEVAHINGRSIAEDARTFETIGPTTSSDKISHANNTLERLCQIVDRAKEIGVFEKENDVNEHAKRVVKHGRSIMKRGENIQKRTEILLDKQIRECLESTLADKQKSKKAMKILNKKSSSKTKVKNRQNERNGQIKICDIPKTDVVARSSTVDPSSELDQISGADASFVVVKRSLDDGEVTTEQQALVSDIVRISEVNKSSGVDQCSVFDRCYIDRSCRSQSEVAEVSEPDRISGDHIHAADHRESTKQERLDSTTGTNENARPTAAPIITMHSIYQSPLISQVHVGRVMNCARRTSATNKSKIRWRVLPCNSLIPIQPLHMGPFESYKTPYMEKKGIKNAINNGDVSTKSAGGNDFTSLDDNGKSIAVTNADANLKEERISNDQVLEDYSEAEIKENWSDLEKIRENIDKYQQLHSEYISDQIDTLKEGDIGKTTPNAQSNSEESMILKRFLSKVNDLSQKYMVMKSNDVEPPEVFQYSENNDEIHSDYEIHGYRFNTICNPDESVLSPPLQEITPNKNDVAIQKNMKIAFNTNLTKANRKVGAFSKLLYQSGEMVERITNELASCDEIPTDLNLDVWIRESECVNDNEFVFLQKELSELDLDISTIEYDDNANHNILISFEDELKRVIKECLSVLTENQLKCDFTNVFCVHGIVSKSSILIVKNFIDRNEEVDFSVIQYIMVELVDKCLDMIDDRSINQIDILPSIQREITEFISAIKKGELVMPDKIMFDINSELKEWKYYLNDRKPSIEKVRSRKSPPKKDRSKKLNEELRTILFSSSNLLEAMNEYVEKGENERFKDSTYTQKEYNKWIANFSSYIIRIRVFNYIGVLYKNYLKASREGRLRMSLSNLMNYILPKDQWIGSDEFTPGFKPEDASRQINIWLSAWRKFVMYKISGPEIGRLISEKERVIKSSILKSVAKGRANSKSKDRDTTIRAFDKILEETCAIEERSKCCQTDPIENFDDVSIDKKYCLCTAIKSEVKSNNTSEIETNSTLLDSFVFGTQTLQMDIRNKFAKEPRIQRIMNLFWDYIDIVLKVTENPKMPELILQNPDPVLSYIQNKSCLKYGLHVESNTRQSNNTPSANALYFIDSLRNINMHIYVNILEERRLRLQYNILLKKLTAAMYKVGVLFKDHIEGKRNVLVQTCAWKPCSDPSNNLSVVPLLKVQSTRHNEAGSLAGKGISKIMHSNANQESIGLNQSQINNESESWYNDPDSDNDDSFDFFLKKNNIVIKEFKKRLDLNENSNSQGIFIEEIDTGMMFFKRRKRQVKLTDHLSEVSTLPNTEMDSDDGTDPDILEITDSDDEKDEFNEINAIRAISPNNTEVTTDTQIVVNEKNVELQNRELDDRKMHIGIEVIHESHSTQTDLRVVEEKIEELCKGLEAASVSQEKSKKPSNSSANGVQKVTSKKSILLKTVAKQIDPKSVSQSSLLESAIQKHDCETALNTAPVLRNPTETSIASAVKQIDPKSFLHSSSESRVFVTLPKNEREIAKYTAEALRNAKQTLNAAAFDSIQANQSKDVFEGQNQCMKHMKDPAKPISSHRDSLASMQQSVIKQVANKQCDKPQHHVVCKAGHCHTCPDELQQCHVTNGVCTCCYCTIFGHTSSASSSNHSSVSSKLGETRERLRSLLHKKRQNFKAQAESPPPSTDQQSQTDISEQMSNMNIKECSSRHTTSSESSPGPDTSGNTANGAMTNIKCQVLPSKCHIVKCKAAVRCQCQLVKTRYQHSCSAAGNNWVPQKAGPTVRPTKVQGTARLSKAVIQRKAQGLPSPRAPPAKAQQCSVSEIDSDQQSQQNVPKVTQTQKYVTKTCYAQSLRPSYTVNSTKSGRPHGQTKLYDHARPGRDVRQPRVVCDIYDFFTENKIVDLNVLKNFCPNEYQFGAKREIMEIVKIFKRNRSAVRYPYFQYAQPNSMNRHYMNLATLRYHNLQELHRIQNKATKCETRYSHEIFFVPDEELRKRCNSSCDVEYTEYKNDRFFELCNCRNDVPSAILKVFEHWKKISKAKIETALDLKADLKPYSPDTKQNKSIEKDMENIKPNSVISKKTGVTIDAIKKTEEAVRKTEEIVKIMEDACKLNEETARISRTVAKNANPKAKSAGDAVRSKETIEMNNSFEDAKRNPRLTANSPVRVSEKNCNCDNAAEVSKKCIHTGYTRVPIQAYATSIQNQPAMTPQSPCLENHSNLDIEEQIVLEDTRDLNQLLEYIEGPIKGVDKGKKKAKKARQKAKKIEQRLMAEQQELTEELIKARKSLEEKRIVYKSMRMEFDEVKRELRQQQQQLAKKKGKSKRAARPSPTQQALIQTTAEKIGKITMKLNSVEAVYLSTEHSVSSLMSRLASCNMELRDVRRDIGDDDSDEGEGDGELEPEGESRGGSRGAADHDMEADPPLQHEEGLKAAPLKANSLAEAVKTLTAHAPAVGEGAGAGDNPLVVTIRRGQQGVTLTWAPTPGGPTMAGGHDVVQVQHENASNYGLNSDNKKKDKIQKVDVAKKPSWESALSQIKELAKPAGKKERKEKKEKEKEKDRDKDKKKKCKDKSEENLPKNEEKNSKKKVGENKNSVPVSNRNSATSANYQSQASSVCEEVTLTKKQRKQARRQEAEQKLMATFQEEKAKEDLRHQGKGRPVVEERGTNDKALSKGVQKLQKQQLNSANHQLLLRESQKLKQQNKAAKDKSKHKDEANGNQKPQYQAMPSIGTSHPTAGTSTKPLVSGGPGGPGACSIMEQLTCGVQVADLRLPPGITLTRVDPNRQTNAKTIPSKPTSELLNQIPPPTLPSAHLITGLPPNASQAHLLTGLTHTQAQMNAAQAHMLSGLPPNAPQAHLITGLPSNASQAYLSASQAHLVAGLPIAGHGRAAPQGASYLAPNVVVLDPRSKQFEYQSKIHIPDAPPLNCPKGKKGKKKGKKPNIPQMEYHTTKMYESEPPKTENTAPKMVTLKNPMFFSNQSTGFVAPDRSTLVADGPRMTNPITSNSSYSQNNIPMTSNNCQATITPTSNGMYTIRNPMMQLLHKNQNIEENPMKNEEIVQSASVPVPKYVSIHENYPNVSEHRQISINPIQSLRFTQDSTCQTSPKRDISSNVVSTKTYEGYSLFKNTPNDNLTVITTNSSNTNVHYLNSASDTITTGFGQKTCFPDVPGVNLGVPSVFSDNLVNKVEPIGTQPKRNEDVRTNSYYTPFGTDRNLRSAIFQGNSSERQLDSKAIGSKRDPEHKSQELATLLKHLTVGSHLNDEVTIHSVTESKFYKPEGLDTAQNNNGSVEITLVSNNNQSVELPYQSSQNSQPISSAVFNRTTKNVWAVGNNDLENVNLSAKAVESLVMAPNNTPSSLYESTPMSRSTSDSPAVSDGNFSRAIGEKQQEMTSFPIGYQTRRSSYETNYLKQRTQEGSFGERNLTAGSNMNERSDLSIAAERLRDLGMTGRSMSREHQNFKDIGLVSERSLYGCDSNEKVLMGGERSIYSTDFRSSYSRDVLERPAYSKDLNATLYKDMSVESERSYNRDMKAYGNTDVPADRTYSRDLGYNTMERTSFTANTNECMALDNDSSSNLYGNSGYTISGTGINQQPLYGRIEDESLNSYASQPTVSQRLLLNGLRRSGDDNATTFYGDSVFAPNQTITNLNELDSSERDIESFKRFDFYFDPPKNKPKINLNVQDIALQLGRNPNAKDNK